jgi:GNAT superfamily N-acetyltransferase
MILLCVHYKRVICLLPTRLCGWLSARFSGFPTLYLLWVMPTSCGHAGKPARTFAAVINNEVVGSNFAANWGSVGFFGPLTIRPDLWDRGVGKRLMEPVMDCFDSWQTKHAGLFTFAHSQKHIGMYQKFGFYPRFLTAIMSKPAGPGGRDSVWTKFSDATPSEQAAILAACREVTEAIYEGLDVGQEIRAVADQQLGDTVLLWDGSKLTGFAVCHSGAGSEAGSGVCYVKFGAARPGAEAEKEFGRLINACEEMALTENLNRLAAGVNTARHEAADARPWLSY